ncbi:phosphatase PAP2 family protein [Roseburia hominis]
MEFLWALSEIRTPLFDQIFQWITYLGQELVLISVLCALYWCLDKKLATQIGLTYVCAGLCVQSLKITFRIPRPWVLDPKFQAVESAVPAATGYSFPSGHTQGGTSLFAPLALASKKWYGKCFYTALFLLIGFSRMYLGCHTPKDVLTAMALSLLFALLIWRFREALENPLYVRRISLLSALGAVAVCVYSYLLYSGGVIEARYVSDCFKASGAAFGFGLGWYLETRYLNFSTAGRHDTENVADGPLGPVSSARPKLLRFVIGITLTALLQFGMKALVGTNLAGQTIQHMLIIFWIIFLYPYCFTRLQL